jgi:hypothetical protein
MAHLETKPEELHLERLATTDDDQNDIKLVGDNANEASLDSNMSFGQTVRLYWKPLLMCLGTAICAMGDGYQFKMPGNIVALRGFVSSTYISSGESSVLTIKIDQMGSPNAAGVNVLNPQHVAIWGGESTSYPFEILD